MAVIEERSRRVQWTNSLFRFLLLAVCSSVSEAFTPPQGDFLSARRNIVRAETGYPLFAETSGNGIQTVDLGKMGSDHEKEGQLMADSIVRWLDVEWFPQQVHVEMAESAKQSYIQCRENNQNDVMDIMMQISNDLHENWAKYNDDAFINAWDVGNYCSDYLVQRSGNEGCGCASEIF